MRKLLIILILASMVGAAVVGWSRYTPTAATFHVGAASRATTAIAVQVGHEKTHGHKKKHGHKKQKRKIKAAKAAYPAACAAKSDASAGSWSSAESEYVVAETQAVKNLGAATVFASLVLDAGAVALDQVGGTSTTSSIATYNRDLAAGQQWFKGCK